TGTNHWSLYANLVAANGSMAMGEPSVLEFDDSGNGGLLEAQQAFVAQTGILQSLSLYVTTAAGQLRMGVYDATGPGGIPGAEIAETAVITPALGWNTTNVTSPRSLQPGTYWLVYWPSSGGLHIARAGTGNGKFVEAPISSPISNTSLPATYPTPTLNGEDHW